MKHVPFGLGVGYEPKPDRVSELFEKSVTNPKILEEVVSAVSDLLRHIEGISCLYFPSEQRHADVGSFLVAFSTKLGVPAGVYITKTKRCGRYVRVLGHHPGAGAKIVIFRNLIASGKSASELIAYFEQEFQVEVAAVVAFYCLEPKHVIQLSGDRRVTVISPDWSSIVLRRETVDSRKQGSYTRGSLIASSGVTPAEARTSSGTDKEVSMSKPEDYNQDVLSEDHDPGCVPADRETRLRLAEAQLKICLDFKPEKRFNTAQLIQTIHRGATRHAGPRKMH